jgi:D-lactate dehydrogenase
MRIAIFDTHSFDRAAFTTANERFGFDITYLEARLTRVTAGLAIGFPVICPFVNDRLDADTLSMLHASGVKLVALRSAGYNHVDLQAATNLALPVVRVPEYSPFAVAEHAVALLLALNRKIHRAFNRVREANFSLDGLVGFDVHGKTVGLIGIGRIGAVVARIMRGFGCRLLAFDVERKPTLVDELQLQYVDLPDLYRQSDIVSLHVPLTPATHHLIDAAALGLMKRGVVLINTGRGALIDTRALVDALKREHIGAAGLDVYEEEEGIFFRNLSDRVLQDDVLARLLTFPNVLVTSHQAFLTREALANIADTTLSNARAFERGEPLANQVLAERLLR